MKWLARQIRDLPAFYKRCDIKKLDNVSRCRLLRLMNAAVQCAIRAFIPMGNVEEAYEYVASKLLTFSRNSYFISDEQKNCIIEDMAKVCAVCPL